MVADFPTTLFSNFLGLLFRRKQKLTRHEEKRKRRFDPAAAGFYYACALFPAVPLRGSILLGDWLRLLVIVLLLYWIQLFVPTKTAHLHFAPITLKCLCPILANERDILMKFLTNCLICKDK